MHVGFSKDRHELNALHAISNGTGSNMAGSSSRNANSPWKQKPTVIPKPIIEKDQPHSVRISNPYNDGIRGNPSSTSLVPVHNSPSFQSLDDSDGFGAHKKSRIEHAVPAAVNGGTFVDSRGYHASSILTRGRAAHTIAGGFGFSSRTRPKRKQKKDIPFSLASGSHVIINVDEEEDIEDVGEPVPLPASESSDDLRLHDGEQPGRDDYTLAPSTESDLGRRSQSCPEPIERSEKHAEQFLPPPTGPHTRALRKKFYESTSTGENEADPIQDADELMEPIGYRKRKATPSRTTEFSVGHVPRTAMQFEDLSRPPEIDLLHPPAVRNKNMVSKMKSKQGSKVEQLLSKPNSTHAQNLSKAPRRHPDSIATSSTQFRSKNALHETAVGLALPIAKWICGTRLHDSLSGIWLVIRDSEVSMVKRSADNSIESMIELSPDILNASIPQNFDDDSDFLCVGFRLNETDRLRSLFEGDDQWEMAMVFLKDHPEWKTEIYEDAIHALKSAPWTKELLDLPACRAYWEAQERRATATQADLPAVPLTRSTRPKPRPSFSGARMSDSSENIREANATSGEPWLRRSSRRKPNMNANVSPKPNRPPSPPAEETILLYPPTGTGAVNVTNGDLKRLEPGEYLNDTLIELGLKFWLNDFKQSNPTLAEQVHVFSSFFYTQLNQKNVEEGYQNVRKWTSKFDLFKKRYIVVPINEHMHWYLAIICYPDRALREPSIHPITPNVTTRNQLRESFSRSELPGLSPPPQSSSKSLSDSSSSASVDETVVEDICTAPVPPESAERDPLSLPPSPVSTTHAENEGRTSTPSPMNVDDPTLSRAWDRRAIPTSTFYGTSDAEMRSVSREKDEEEVDELETGDGMEVDDIPSATEQKEVDPPYIFSFDSLGARHPHAVKLLSIYLDLEAKDKKNISSTTSAIRKQALVPTQTNFCDCGLYLLHFVEQFMSNPETLARHIANHGKSRKSSVDNRLERAALWNHAAVAGKREDLKQRILALSADWKREKEADEKGKEVADVPDSTHDESTTVDDSDIEVLDVVPGASKDAKSTQSRAPSLHKAQRIR